MPHANAFNIAEACRTLAELLGPRDTSGLVATLMADTRKLPDDERLSHDNYAVEKIGQCVEHTFALVETFLTDVHRIADALERIAASQATLAGRGTVL